MASENLKFYMTDKPNLNVYKKNPSVLSAYFLIDR